MSIFLDFDGTITTEDTVTHLANFALRFQSERRHRQDNTTTTTTTTSAAPARTPTSSQNLSQQQETGDLSSRWEKVVNAYITDYRSHVSAYEPCASDRQCEEDEVTFLRSQKNVETRSLGRLNECALFRGISRAAFRQAGRELVRDGTVRLRPGFSEFVRKGLAKGWRVHVVSVNWSAAFIEGACGFAEGEVSVFANEVREGDGAVLGPRILGGDRNLTNSCDKLDVVRAIMREQGAQGKPSFYFGDSTTDMECLLVATQGVVMADTEDSTLIQTLRRIGKEVLHVRDAGATKGLVWASNYEEAMTRFELDLE
ncbi:hypothetical protein F5Y19DRAFT_428041 [Xylariaceae sp. FL1651]|nr:hypothetical protein F5Y19DRAFT_428041 [Xylariaceae sp. FL1651]